MDWAPFGDIEHELRLHYRRRGFGGLHSRQSPFGVGSPFGAAARSGRQGQLVLVQDPGGFHQDVLQRNLQLDVLQRAREGTRQPADLLPTRQSAGRLRLDQRDDLRARPAARFRRLGGGGEQGLGLSRRAAVFPQARIASAWQHRVSRRGRPNPYLADEGCRPSDLPRVPERLRPGRLQAQRRLQRRAIRRRGHLRREYAQRAAFVEQLRIPASGADAQEPDGRA